MRKVGINEDFKKSNTSPEPSNPTTVGLEKCNTGKQQKKGSKIAMNIIKDLKNNINKSLNEAHQNKLMQKTRKT